MSYVRSEEYKRILTTIFDRYTNIVRSFIYHKILINYNYEFKCFLEQHKHDFFTRTFQKITCCCCRRRSPSTYIWPSIPKTIYNQLYDTDYAIPCKSTNQKNVKTQPKCFCKIIVKDVSLDSLDIGALACIAEQSGKLNGPPVGYINKIKEVRHELCHAPQTDAFSSQKNNDQWDTIEKAIDYLLDQMNIDRYLKMILTKDIEDIKQIKTTLPIQALMSLERKVETVGKKILQATRKKKNQKVENQKQASTSQPATNEQIHHASCSIDRIDKEIVGSATSIIPTLKRKSVIQLEQAEFSFHPKIFKRDEGTYGTTGNDDVAGDILHSSTFFVPIRLQTEFHAFTIVVDDIPTHLQEFKEMSEVESGRTVCVQWSWDCPTHWNISDIVANMNKNISNQNGWFRPFLVYEDKMTGRLILQCFTQCQLFNSFQQFELEVKNFIELIEDKCQLQTYTELQQDKRDDVGIRVSFIMTPDNYLLEDDPQNIKSKAGMEESSVSEKRTDLDNALVRLGVIKCLEVKYKEFRAKATRNKKQTHFGTSPDIKRMFYRNLSDMVLKRKKENSTSELIKRIKSNLSVAMAEFPELDVFEEYTYSCGSCSSNDVICWCEECKQLYCFHCLKLHNDFSHCLAFSGEEPGLALTMIKTYDSGLAKNNTLIDMKVMGDKLLMLTYCNQRCELVLWTKLVLKPQIILNAKYDYSSNYRIAIIDSLTFAVQTNACIIIVSVNDYISTDPPTINTTTACRSFAYANGIFYILFDSYIMKMTLDGNKVGEIKRENIQALYANGTQIYYTTTVKHQYVNVIDTINDDAIRSLKDFPTFPNQIDFTKNGNVLFLKGNNLWFTCDEGRCCYILICDIFEDTYSSQRYFCLSNNELYLALGDSGFKIREYKFDETKLQQSGLQHSRSSKINCLKLGMMAPHGNVDDFQASLSALPPRQLCGNSGPSQSYFNAPSVQTHWKSPLSPPDDRNIPSEEDLSNESIEFNSSRTDSPI